MPSEDRVGARKKVLEGRVHAEDGKVLVENHDAVRTGIDDLVRPSFGPEPHKGDTHLRLCHALGNGDRLVPARVVATGAAVELLLGIRFAGALQDSLYLLFRDRGKIEVFLERGMKKIAGLKRVADYPGRTSPGCIL